MFGHRGRPQDDPDVTRQVPDGDPGAAGVVAGYDGDLPEPARLAMLMLVSQWYDRREPVVVGSSVAELPFAVEALLESVSWRVSG